MAEEPWAPQRLPETRAADLAPTLSRFAHLGARVQTQNEAPNRGPEPLAPARTSRDDAEEKKVSFWRRIALPRSPAPEQAPAPSLHAVLEQMHVLQAQLETQQVRAEERMARSEEALRQIWDRDQEASLSALRQRLAGLEVDQTEAEEALRRATRGLKALAALLLITVASGVGALLFLTR